MKLLFAIVAVASWLVVGMAAPYPSRSSDKMNTKAVLQALAALQQLPEQAEMEFIDWCVWIPEPVRKTLDACKTMNTKAVLQALAALQQLPEQAEMEFIDYCAWIPEPVRKYLHACKDDKAKEEYFAAGLRKDGPGK